MIGLWYGVVFPHRGVARKSPRATLIGLGRTNVLGGGLEETVLSPRPARAAHASGRSCSNWLVKKMHKVTGGYILTSVGSSNRTRGYYCMSNGKQMRRKYYNQNLVQKSNSATP